MKREKTKYPGITFREIPRLDGHGTEKMYYVRYRRGGRGSPETEEPLTTTPIPKTVLTTTTVAGATISTDSGAFTISESGDLTGRYDGAEETVPKHTYVRYFIRAIP